MFIQFELVTRRLRVRGGKYWKMLKFQEAAPLSNSLFLGHLSYSLTSTDINTHTSHGDRLEMRGDVRDFIAFCSACSKSKPCNHHPVGLLYVLPSYSFVDVVPHSW